MNEKAMGGFSEISNGILGSEKISGRGGSTCASISETVTECLQSPQTGCEAKEVRFGRKITPNPVSAMARNTAEEQSRIAARMDSNAKASV
jgi:hypothetical protein